jgi:hypothetical protein
MEGREKNRGQTKFKGGLNGRKAGSHGTRGWKEGLDERGDIKGGKGRSKWKERRKGGEGARQREEWEPAKEGKDDLYFLEKRLFVFFDFFLEKEERTGSGRAGKTDGWTKWKDTKLEERKGQKGRGREEKTDGWIK